MDNKKGGIGFFDGVSMLVRGELLRRKSDQTAIFYDIAVFLVSIFFARCHIAFSAYPLGAAFVAVLSRGVWIALVGAVVGSLSLGSFGVIHAVVAILVVLLRAILSGRDAEGEPTLFSEPLLFRISSAAVASFVGALYELIYDGFSLGAVLYGVLSVLSSGAFTFLLSGIFDGGVSFSEVLFGSKNIFFGKKSEKEKFGLIFFQGAFLLFCFLISLSLLQYEFLGINLSYIFSFAATLFCARRFGTFRAVAVGFVSGLAASGSLSVSFALAGLGAGLLFRVSVAYALLFGGVLLSGWSVYVGGAMGFLTVFPEYVSTSLIMLPLLKRLHTEQSCEEEGVDAVAENMVSMSALAYKGSDNGSLSELESALFSISSSFRALGLGEERVSYEEYRDLAVRCAEDFCKRCPEYEACKERNPAPCAENIDIIAAKLYKNERIEAYDKSIAPVYCKYARELFEAITASAGELFEARYKSRRMEIRAEEYELFSKLVGEARTSSERERTQDSELSERLLGVFEEVGFSGGSIRVFGDRKKKFIGAGPDADGSIVTSSELRRGIEEASGVKLGVPEFYRRGDIALFECSSAPLFRVEIATAAERASVDEVSGDTVRSFESADGRFYALISDGMGSGDAASKTSRFAADFLSKILNASPKKSTALHFLNHIIRNSTDECSATVDLFELDLYKGEALFFKCGAAASYVKRGGSIFRVRSETAPIGLMKTIDAERIRVEIKGGDYVVMISDGISQSLDDAAWLFELLNKEPPERLSDFAEQILLGAKEHTAIKDDKSVAVIKIKSL